MVGEAFPALALVRAGAAFLDRQHGVEQQHALPRPRQQAAVVGAGDAQVALDLLEDVVQRWRHRHAGQHRETQAVRLSRAVVRILAQDHHLHLVERRRIERREDLRPRRKDPRTGLFALAQERGEFAHLGRCSQSPTRAFQEGSSLMCSFSGMAGDGTENEEREVRSEAKP